MFSDAFLVMLFVNMMVLTSMPLLLFAILRIRYKVGYFPLLVGLITYLAFSIELESVVNGLLLMDGSSFGELVNNNGFVFVVYVSLMTGLFEEGGKFVACKLFLKDKPEIKHSLSFGIGYAWLEAIVVGVLPAFMNMSYATVLNESGREEFLSAFTEIGVEEGEQIIEQLTAMSAMSNFMDIVERLCWFAIQAALSVVMFYAVRLKAYKYVGLAAGLHVVAILPAALMNIGAISDIYTGRIIELLICAIIVYIAVIMYKSFKEDVSPKLIPSFAEKLFIRRK